tara:strand:+ start:21642 stop:22226 length:585 start_codon:yes stop_codon:yes gene_type:complete
MKNYLLTFFVGCLLFSTSNLLGQSEKDTIWYDANWNESAKNIAAYFRPKPETKDKGYWWVDYYISGALQMEALSLDKNKEVFDGKVTWFYENGHIMQTVNYKNNVLEGARKDYFENGPLKSQYAYINGKRAGDWVGFYENGKMHESGSYVDGERDGHWKEYHTNGKLKGEGKYSKGKKIGIWKMHYYDGIEEEE